MYILDIRDEASHKLFHPSGAVNFPLETVKERCKDLNSKRPVVLFCDAKDQLPPVEETDKPTKAYQAAHILMNEGFPSVYVLKGDAQSLVDYGFMYYGDENHLAKLKEAEKEKKTETEKADSERKAKMASERSDKEKVKDELRRKRLELETKEDTKYGTGEVRGEEKRK